MSMLATEQSRRGWCVHVGVRQGGVHLESLRVSGVAVHFLGDHRGINPLLLSSINALIKQTKPHVVQTWLPQMDIVGGMASWWNSVPWIVSERSNRLAYQGMRLRAWVRCYVARYANGVVANSLNGVSYWREMLPPGAHVFQVANAVDVAAIRNAAFVYGPYSNLNDGRKNVLVVGRLAPEKAVDIVIQAIRFVPVKHDIRVLIIGEGSLREEIGVNIGEAGLDDRIFLLPYRPDWWGMLKDACALVSMSRFEGQPNVVLETMAAGCPLIVSDIPAHREFLDKDSAIIVTPDNPAMLAEAIISLLGAPESARQRAERASSCVDGMTIQSAADAYESVYEKILSEREG